jgi:heme oxygenase (biliverdin-IX-beta and delta-forming)
MTRLVDRLSDETRSLHKEIEVEGEALLRDITVDTYRRYLARWYGFIFPVERSLADVPALDRVHDSRRLRKHLLLQHDLQVLGLKLPEIQALPQCMSVPFFDDLREAVGWSFVIERSTLDHPNLYRQLAGVIPGDVAFAASYLKCYSGSVGEMWRAFGESIEAAAGSPEDAERIIEAARAGYRHFRRWRNTIDGKTLSIVETPLLSRGRTT